MTLGIDTMNTNSEKGKSTRLLKLAEDKFGSELTEAQKKLFIETANGCVADYGDRIPTEDEQWDSDHLLEADHIKWLCTDPEAIQYVTYKGVKITGAYIDGVIELNYSRINFPLSIMKCTIPYGIDLIDSCLFNLNLEGTNTGRINASGMNVKRSVFLRNGFKAIGNVDLVACTIEGNLDCNNSSFYYSDPNNLDADIIEEAFNNGSIGKALDADSITVSG